PPAGGLQRLQAGQLGQAGRRGHVRGQDRRRRRRGNAERRHRRGDQERRRDRAGTDLEGRLLSVDAMRSERWAPRVTVATVVSRAGQLLLVEEEKAGRRVLNQPAEHLEPGESLL